MERIGEYLVKRLIGEGGMGKVYEAEERLSKRRVALKVLRPELTKSDEGRRLFLNELQILAHLEHPNLVRSLASVEDGDKLVMVLEYLEGRTLRDELTRRRSLPWSEALEHVVHIAEALAVAHEQEPAIVHRDLKPENVMLLCEEGPDGAPSADAPVTGLKVMDFGVAKVLAEVNVTNTQSVGTLQYMSPEQIDAGAVDARADLYALGLVFYEMLAGEVPFHSASPRELLNLQCTAEPPELSDEVRRGLPRGVENTLFALLEKSPEKRPASAREVIDALEPFRAAESEAASRARRTAGPKVTSRTHVSTGGGRSEAEADAGEKDAASESEPASEPRTESARAERTPSAKKVERLDTVALVERAGTPRDVPLWLGVLVIVVLSAAASLTTYRLRVAANARAAAGESASATAASQTASQP
ncbi:MAG: serine/threonine protein kinase [Myxococcales bacterium]|nr:serine/threonine protein kinase [Myxococcales bacterium]HQY61484.1 serine/threonine-protein kinase [Polyangiaceae bacterium]